MADSKENLKKNPNELDKVAGGGGYIYFKNSNQTPNTDKNTDSNPLGNVVGMSFRPV